MRPLSPTPEDPPVVGRGLSDYLAREIQSRPLSMKLFLVLAQALMIATLIYGVIQGLENSDLERTLHYIVIAVCLGLLSLSAIVVENQYDLVSFLVVLCYLIAKLVVKLFESDTSREISLDKDHLIALGMLVVSALSAIGFFVLVYRVFLQMGRNSSRAFYAAGNDIFFKWGYSNWLKLITVLKIDFLFSAQVLISAAFLLWDPLTVKIACGLYLLVTIWYALALYIVRRESKPLAALWCLCAVGQPAYAGIVFYRFVKNDDLNVTVLLQCGAFIIVRVCSVFSLFQCSRSWGTGFTETVFAAGKPDGPVAEGQKSVIDWNTVFAYQTVKMVKIFDKRLGFLHHFVAVAVVAYVIGYTLVFEKMYQEIASPVGTVRLQLQLPEKSVQKIAGVPPYCGRECGDDSCRYIGSSGDKFVTLPCLYTDQYFVAFPIIDESVMLLTSRVNITNQTASGVCPTSPSCSYGGVVNSYYISHLEKYTLYIDHTMSVPEFNLTANAFSMEGQMDGPNGPIDPCASYRDLNMKCPSYVAIGTEGQPDILPISSLLQAAGIDLDSHSGAHSATGDAQGSGRRFDGVVLLVTIEYTNRHTYNPNNIKYTYKVREIPKAEFKSVQQIVSPPNLNYRVLNNRHGIAILVQQSGTIGRFNFVSMLLNLVAGLGLMAVATALSDITATKILENKIRYRSWKYQEPTKPRRKDHTCGRGSHRPAGGYSINPSSLLSPDVTLSDHNLSKLDSFSCDSETSDEISVASYSTTASHILVKTTISDPMPCAVCGNMMVSGTEGYWSRGKGIFHKRCAKVPSQ